MRRPIPDVPFQSAILAFIVISPVISGQYSTTRDRRSDVEVSITAKSMHPDNVPIHRTTPVTLEPTSEEAEHGIMAHTTPINVKKPEPTGVLPSVMALKPQDKDAPTKDYAVLSTLYKNIILQNGDYTTLRKIKQNVPPKKVSPLQAEVTKKSSTKATAVELVESKLTASKYTARAGIRSVQTAVASTKSTTEGPIEQTSAVTERTGIGTTSAQAKSTKASGSEEGHETTLSERKEPVKMKTITRETASLGDIDIATSSTVGSGTQTKIREASSVLPTSEHTTHDWTGGSGERTTDSERSSVDTTVYIGPSILKTEDEDTAASSNTAEVTPCDSDCTRAAMTDSVDPYKITTHMSIFADVEGAYTALKNNDKNTPTFASADQENTGLNSNYTGLIPSTRIDEVTVMTGSSVKILTTSANTHAVKNVMNTDNSGSTYPGESDATDLNNSTTGSRNAGIYTTASTNFHVVGTISMKTEAAMTATADTVGVTTASGNIRSRMTAPANIDKVSISSGNEDSKFSTSADNTSQFTYSRNTGRNSVTASDNTDKVTRDLNTTNTRKTTTKSAAVVTTTPQGTGAYVNSPVDAAEVTTYSWSTGVRMAVSSDVDNVNTGSISNSIEISTSINYDNVTLSKSGVNMTRTRYSDEVTTYSKSTDHSMISTADVEEVSISSIKASSSTFTLADTNGIITNSVSSSTNSISVSSDTDEVTIDSETSISAGFGEVITSSEETGVSTTVSADNEQATTDSWSNKVSIAVSSDFHKANTDVGVTGADTTTSLDAEKVTSDLKSSSVSMIATEDFDETTVNSSNTGLGMTTSPDSQEVLTTTGSTISEAMTRRNTKRQVTTGEQSAGGRTADDEITNTGEELASASVSTGSTGAAIDSQSILTHSSSARSTTFTETNFYMSTVETFANTKTVNAGTGILSGATSDAPTLEYTTSVAATSREKTTNQEADKCPNEQCSTHEPKDDKPVTKETANDGPTSDKFTFDAPSKEKQTTEHPWTQSTSLPITQTTSRETTRLKETTYTAQKTGIMPESGSDGVNSKQTTSNGIHEEKPTSAQTTAISTDGATFSSTLGPPVTNVVSTDITVSQAATPGQTSPERSTMSTSLPGQSTQKTGGAGGDSRPDNPPGLEPNINSVPVVLALDADYGSCVRGREWQFREHMRRQMSSLLRVPMPAIRNVRVRPGSVLVQADLVPVKTPVLELDRNALLAARRELRDRVNRGTAVVSDLDGNRLAVFTTNTRTLLPPRVRSQDVHAGHPYSLPLLCAVSALFVATALVIAASVWVAKKHLTPTPVAPSIEEGAGPRPESASEFLALVPARLLSSRLTGPASAATLQLLERKVPRRESVPEPPVYLPPTTSTLVETSVAPSTANGTLGGWSTSPETVTPGTTAHSSREWLSTRSTSFQTEKSYSEASRPETVAK